MKRHIKVLTLLIVVLLLGLISACKPKSGQLTRIVLADCGWDSQMFHNALAKLVIENAYEGYTVSSSTASSIMNYESLKKGDVDLQIETWHENLLSFAEDEKNGLIIRLGVLVPDSRQGLYVPRYVVEGDKARSIAPKAPGLKHVKDLLKYPKVFPDDENPSLGRLYGSIPGWAADEILSKKFKYYGLDKCFKYIRLGSESAIFTSLMSAYNLGHPWVGYCYEPTWIAGKLDLILLEDAPYDPKGYAEGKTAFSTQELLNVCSTAFPSKAPDILEFIKKYKTGSKLISDALAHLDETKASHADTAVWFLKKYSNLIDEWLPAPNAGKLKEYLSKR